MNEDTGFALAAALALLMAAGVSFFVAFHPGGVQVGGSPAKNPQDVLKWIMTEAASGNSSEASATPAGTLST